MTMDNLRRLHEVVQTAHDLGLLVEACQKGSISPVKIELYQAGPNKQAYYIPSNVLLPGLKLCFNNAKIALSDLIDKANK